MQWFAAAIQAARHKKICGKLGDNNIDYYFPMRVSWTKRRTGPRQRKEFPLLAGYVFVHVDFKATSARTILSIDGIRHFLCHEGEPEAIDARQIDRIRDAEQRGAYDETLKFIGGLMVGDRIVIEHGIWAGRRGIVRQIVNGDIVSDVELFGRSTPIKINVDNVAKAI